MPSGPNQSMVNTSGFQLDPKIDSIEEVLQIRAAALRSVREGVKILEWSGNGTEVSKVFVAPVSEVLAETRHFLKLADPETYGHIVRQSNVIRLM